MADNEVLVKVEGLSKKFCKDLKTSLWYGVKDLFSNLRGNRKERHLREKEFWALKDINFELRRGECLGLIGHNGAGKSTLLKILNGLMKPDAGKVTMKGRVGALIELGAGFNPILTGRENIYNNGAVLGFTRAEIKEKIEEIIDFAELREFIDMPVKNYSSGMNVRLGFAIAAQMKPDVLIIDEVLAVGDLGFILKCFKTIDNILPNTAIIFVSHNMPMVSRICSEILLLDHGRSKFYSNDVGEGIDKYYSSFINNNESIVFDDGTLELNNVRLLSNSIETTRFYWNDNLSIQFSMKFKEEVEVPLFRILIYDKEQRPVAILNPNNKDSKLEIINGRLDFLVNHKNLQLSKGFYSINLTVFKANSNNPHLRINNIAVFQLIHPEDHFQSFLLKSEYQQINR
ncbi:ABC transporter ATP-binding protein [Christiangramia sp. SM2212]|uniref:ABC transporter ATP-binding protein n=1 Tax=Christiangramia sediminicola TaxID=3073267 RepID=A0ABU1ENS8_9FLAO|nr:ABC transporter ATP-binding protein [Christiangramia sp. SM2212]MDR5589697.1 ABC transporter ATP-binding protein [Christiangramia sp. SM2212]